jgi:excisionase family DNA binding protein
MITKPYSTKEIANLTGFHPNAVTKAIQQGRLKATKLGHDYLVWPTDLANWIRNHPQPSRVAHINPLEVLR